MTNRILKILMIMVLLTLHVTNFAFANYENDLLYDGWANNNLSVMENPDINSEILSTLKFNDYIQYIPINDQWVLIKYEGEDAYINRRYISDIECNYNLCKIPSNRGFKSYMSYKSITSKSSKQYKIQSKYAYTGEYGIRQVNGRYCIAVGTGVNANVGTYIDLILNNGIVIPCIVGDIKDDKHTQSNNIVTAHNGCVSEFIIDKKLLDKNARRLGDVSVCNDSWRSPVIEMKIYDKNIFE